MRRVIVSLALIATVNGGVLAQGHTIVAPPVAYPGGTLTGVVVDEDDRHVSGAPIELTMESGDVVTTETDASGRFAFDVPLGLAVSVGLGEGEARVPLGNPAEVPAPAPRAPALAATAAGFTLRGVVTDGWIRGAEGERTSLPLATAAPPEGEGLTLVYLPPGLAAGPATVSIRRPGGRLEHHPVGVFRITDADLDRERLTSGQDADFAFRFDFGPGPERTVIVTVVTTGPVAYEENGQPQRVEVDDDGDAEVEGTLEALQGSPTGIPFSVRFHLTPGEGWPVLESAPPEEAPVEEAPALDPAPPAYAQAPPTDLTVPPLRVSLTLGPLARVSTTPPCTDCESIHSLLRAAERRGQSFRSEIDRHRRDRRWAEDDAEWVRQDQARDRAYLETRRRQAREWRQLAADARADAETNRERHRRQPDANWDDWAERDEARARQRDRNAEEIEAEIRRIEGEQVDPDARTRALDRAIADAEREAGRWEGEATRLRRAYEECLRRAEACPETPDGDDPRDTGDDGDDPRDVGPDETICGPDVTDPVLDILDTMAQDYLSADESVQAEACDNLTELVGGDGVLTALYAWDLIPFNPSNTPRQDSEGNELPSEPYGPWFEGISDRCAIPRHYPCGPTVEFMGQCVHAQVLNYIQWGATNELCGNTLEANFWHWVREAGGTSDAFPAQRLISDLGRSFVSLRSVYTDLAADDPTYYTPERVAEQRRQQLAEQWGELIEGSEEWPRRQGAECALACRLTDEQRETLLLDTPWDYVWQGMPDHGRRDRD